MIFHIEQKNENVEVYIEGCIKPMVVQRALPNHRPFLHPILSPDGVGELTEYSPGHHPHQTGLFWGFTRVNGLEMDDEALRYWFYRNDKSTEIQHQVGRDFFHNPGSDYWRRNAISVLKPVGDFVEWETSYDLIDEKNLSIMTEIQHWTVRQNEDVVTLDLVWKGEAHTDITIGRFPYGGLFLRMPYRKEQGGNALNSNGQSNRDADGQSARWVGVEMPIPDRMELDQSVCNVTIMDHPANPTYPSNWRVDGQLGFGPCSVVIRSWELPEKTSAFFRYRLLLARGVINVSKIEEVWEDYVAT